MLLGPYIPGPVGGWRFVERDLYDITSRVIEYDQDARLVREDGTGNLGLARWIPSDWFIKGGYWQLARTVHDLDTDTPLAGVPDGRVMRFMRAADSRGRDLRKWKNQSTIAHWMREKRQYDQMHEENLEMAEIFMHKLGKDVGTGKRAFIRKGL